MEKKDNIFDLADAYILYGVYLAHRTVGRQLKLGSSKLFFWLRQGSHMCLWSDGYWTPVGWLVLTESAQPVSHLKAKQPRNAPRLAPEVGVCK